MSPAKFHTSFFGSLLNTTFSSVEKKAPTFLNSTDAFKNMLSTMNAKKRKTVFMTLERIKENKQKLAYRSKHKHLDKYFKLSDKVDDLKSQLKKEQDYVDHLSVKHQVNRKLSSFSTAASELTRNSFISFHETTRKLCDSVLSSNRNISMFMPISEQKTMSTRNIKFNKSMNL